MILRTNLTSLCGILLVVWWSHGTAFAFAPLSSRSRTFDPSVIGTRRSIDDCAIRTRVYWWRVVSSDAPSGTRTSTGSPVDGRNRRPSSRPGIPGSAFNNTPLGGSLPSALEIIDPDVSSSWLSWTSTPNRTAPKTAQTPLSSQDTSSFLQPETLLPIAFAVVATLVWSAAAYLDLGPHDVVQFTQQLFHHPKETLEQVVEFVASLGPLGPVCFGLVYLIAEILAVPATPLTMSAGYLFGLVQGTSVVLLAATAAASIAFLIGKTCLRSWVEEIVQENDKFRKLDVAIGQEGFKLLLLVRLSPIFPFALSNYLYGASSINFPSYFWGTLLGFAPGTLAYVYTGMVGKALTIGGDDSQPWYVYAGGFIVLASLLKLATDVANDIIGALDDEEDYDQGLEEQERFSIF